MYTATYDPPGGERDEDQDRACSAIPLSSTSAILVKGEGV